MKCLKQNLKTQNSLNFVNEVNSVKFYVNTFKVEKTFSIVNLLGKLSKSGDKCVKGVQIRSFF